MPETYELHQIEDFFNEQRAKARWPYKRLDPTDWAFMAAWQKDGVPFAVICRGIEEVFTNHLRRNAPGKINTVRYCEDAIKKHWKNHGEAHVGSHDKPAQGHQSDFGIERISESLQTWISALNDVVADTEALQDAIFAVIKSLRTLDADLRATELEALDAALLELENTLTAALIAEAETQQRLANYQAEAEKHLAQYKDKMMPGIWQETVDKFIHKKLREEYDIPRLSLFYL